MLDSIIQICSGKFMNKQQEQVRMPQTELLETNTVTQTAQQLTVKTMLDERVKIHVYLLHHLAVSLDHPADHAYDCL